MLTWRYCITRELNSDGSNLFAVREVYEDEKGELSWTENPITPMGEDWKDIANTLALMGNSIGGYVLDLTLEPPQLVKPFSLKR